jgi:acetyltransferase-like isoleucine patch superfamily enzyme
MHLLVAAGISVLPTSGMRCLGYRLLFGYQIRNARLGFGTIILVRKASLDGCRIGKFNRFIGPMTVSIGRNTEIGPLNEFTCGYWTLSEESSHSAYRRHLEVGEDVVVTTHHHFDVAGALVVGSRSWIAGRGSQFWTHGAGVTDRNISIGNDCYISSAVRFAPGSGVCDNCLVGLGSVVVGAIEETHALIAGVPAKVLKRDYDWKSRNEEAVLS